MTERFEINQSGDNTVNRSSLVNEAYELMAESRSSDCRSTPNSIEFLSGFRLVAGGGNVMANTHRGNELKSTGESENQRNSSTHGPRINFGSIGEDTRTSEGGSDRSQGSDDSTGTETCPPSRPVKPPVDKPDVPIIRSPDKPGVRRPVRPNSDWK